MPRGWINRERPVSRRARMWLCIYLLLVWTAAVALAGLLLWIEGDGKLPAFRPIYWSAIAPGAVLLALVLFFRFSETPRPD